MNNDVLNYYLRPLFSVRILKGFTGSIILIGLNWAKTSLRFNHNITTIPYCESNTFQLIFIWVKIAVHPNELNNYVCHSVCATYRMRSNRLKDPLSNFCIAICNTNSEGGSFWAPLFSFTFRWLCGLGIKLAVSTIHPKS